MEIKTLVVGSLEANCYILTKDTSCIIIDPGDEYDKIKKEIKPYKLLGILVTHHHDDHVGALKELLNEYDAIVYEKDTVVENNYRVGPFSFKCVLTPGHSEDSISFYFQENNVMFTGDFLFRGTVGRCDLPSGDFEKMDESIEKIKKFPSDMIVYSGHGDTTTLEQEYKTNPYF